MSEECSMCGATFASAADLVVHRQKAHAHEDPATDVEMNPEAHKTGYMCAMCGARFATPQALAAHNQRPHSLGRKTPQPGSSWA